MTNTTLTIEAVQAMGYKELQVVAKDNGIKANTKKAVLVEAIVAQLVTPAVTNVDAIDAEYEAMMNGEGFEEEPVVEIPVVPVVKALPVVEEMNPLLDVVVSMDYAMIEAIMELELDQFSSLHSLKEQLQPLHQELYANRNRIVVGKETAELKSKNLYSPESVQQEAPGLQSFDSVDDLADAMGSGKPSAASEPKASEQAPTQLLGQQEQEFIKTFEFVRKDNTMVEFKQKGITIKIGWSKTDFTTWIVRDGTKKRVSIQSAINSMKKFVNGRDGDVARIVKAFMQLKSKPSIIVAMEKQSAAPVVEKQSARRQSFVQIDGEWLKEYKEQQGENFNGLDVRAAYESYLQSSVAQQ